jgi:hypothetical protein
MTTPPQADGQRSVICAVAAVGLAGLFALQLVQHHLAISAVVFGTSSSFTGIYLGLNHLRGTWRRTANADTDQH